MLEEFEFPTVEAAGVALAGALVETLRAALAARGRAGLVVSGGRSPAYVFPPLAAADLDWSRIAVTLADERWVPADHADSNEALVRRLLLTGPAAAASFVGLYTGAADAGDGTAACAAGLQGFPFPADAVFLGAGPDGHIASLFPGPGDWLDAEGRCVATRGPAATPQRMSLTPAALLDARRVFLLLGGADKRAVYDRARQPGPVGELPLRLVLHQDRVPVSVYLA